MRRREFSALIGGATVAWPLVGRAQVRKPARIGILSVGTTTEDMIGPTPKNPYVRALLNELSALGHEFGRDFVTEPRGGAGQPERFANLIAELISHDPDVIVAPGPMLAALKKATHTIPVVMSHGEDPIAEGIIESLARPGGNFTGLTALTSELTAKRLELLRELVPGSGPLAVIWDPLSILHWHAAEAYAKQRAWQLISLQIKDASDIENVFNVAASARAEGLFVTAAGPLFARAGFVADLAARNRLPTMYQLRAFVDAGGLISYAPSLIDTWRRAATYVDRILKGAKPADLAVQQPTKFEMVLNLKTARALGLTIPPLVLAQADEVIE